MARRLAAGLLAAEAVLAGCGTPRAPVTPGVVKVVAGENSWGNIAAQIGGPHVQVTSILSSAADPHLYESDVAETPRSNEPAGQLDRHVPSGLGWPGGVAGRPGITRLPTRNAWPSCNDETPS